MIGDERRGAPPPSLQALCSRPCRSSLFRRGSGDVLGRANERTGAVDKTGLSQRVRSSQRRTLTRTVRVSSLFRIPTTRREESVPFRRRFRPRSSVDAHPQAAAGAEIQGDAHRPSSCLPACPAGGERELRRNPEPSERSPGTLSLCLCLPIPLSVLEKGVCVPSVF